MGKNHEPLEAVSYVSKERLVRIVNRIIDNSLTHQDRLAIVDRDGRMKTLYEQFKRAQDDCKLLTVDIIHRQMVARKDEILFDYAGRRIPDLVNSGDIIHFMDDDQRELFNNIRGRAFLLMDAIDTAFLDMSQLLEQNGIPGNITMMREIESARKAIDRWTKDTVPVMKSEASTLAAEESDRVYDYVTKRTEMLERKASRLLAKDERQKAKD